jgi:hypothetical protein
MAAGNCGFLSLGAGQAALMIQFSFVRRTFFDANYQGGNRNVMSML